MRVAVPRAFLVNGKACEEGLEMFRLFSPADDRGVVDPWTQAHTVRLYELHPDSATWLRLRRLIPPPCFDGMDLTGRRLVGADLRYVSFVGADLRDVDFSGADLRKAALLETDLTTVRINAATNLEGAFCNRVAPPGWYLDGVVLRRTA